VGIHRWCGMCAARMLNPALQLNKPLATWAWLAQMVVKSTLTSHQSPANAYLQARSVHAASRPCRMWGRICITLRCSLACTRGESGKYLWVKVSMGSIMIMGQSEA